jgi:hypothetical protein
VTSLPSRALNAAQSHFHRRPILYGALAMFAVLVPLYCFSIGLRASRGAAITGDEPFYLITTQSIIEDFDLDLANQYDAKSYRSYFDHPDGLWRQAPPDTDGRLLSPHNPGLSVLVIPGFVAAGLAGVQVELLLIAALTFALAYVLVTQETSRPLASWLVTLTVGLSATAFVYATEIYPEVPGAFCLVASLLIARAPGRDRLRGIAIVLLLSAFVWLSVKYAPLACIVASLYLWPLNLRERAVFVALGALSGALLVTFHLWQFGHLTPYSTNLVYDGQSTTQVLEQHLGFSDRSYRLYGLFIDQRFGVGRWAPLLLLLLPSLPLLLAKRPLRLVVGALIAAQIATATFLAITMMGWWFPGRTLMTVLPLCALPLTLLLLQLPSPGRILAVALSVMTVLITIALPVQARREEIRLAVDPFDMHAPGFQAMARLFPNYQAWSSETVALTCVWLALLAVPLALTVRHSELWALIPRWRERATPRRPVPVRSSVQQPPAR